MRKPRSASVLPPAALLALAVVFCGGAVAEPGSAAVLLLHPDGGERATQLTRDEAVAKLLSCLGDAAKELGKRYDGQTAALPVHEAPALRVGAVEFSPHVPHLTLHVTPLPHRLLDLPPPVAIA